MMSPSRIHAAVRATAIDQHAVEEMVYDRRAGAMCMFVGRVRDHSEGAPVTALEYSAHETMARRLLHSILADTGARLGCCAVAAEHRVGLLSVGDVSVAVAVSAPHRAEAFAACREIIERIKTDLPVFKLEHHPDRSGWVVPEPVRKDAAS